MAAFSDLTSSCYHAEYIQTMFESHHDDLFASDLMSSSNCEYILIHIPSSMLSFYSVSHQSIIQKWEINDNSIWSIYPSNDTQTISVSNTGCLTWSSDDATILHEICSDSHTHSINMNTTITNYSTASIKSQSNVSDLDNNINIDQILNDPIIWIPISMGIIGTILVIFCLCINRFFAQNQDKQSSNDEDIASSNNSNHIVNDLVTIKEIVSNIENDNDNDDDEDDMGKNMDYMDSTDTDKENNDSDIDIDIELDDDPESVFVFDLRGRRPVSQDVYVQNSILTPTDRYNSSDNDENTQILVCELSQIQEEII